MVETIKITTNQKNVIVGLCTYPNRSDSEVASQFGVKRSTFSTVKRQLIEQSLLSPINIPNFVQMGAKLLAVGFAHFNPLEFDKIRATKPNYLISRLNYFPNLVSTTFESYNGISLLISKSFTDVMLAHNAITGFYLEKELSTARDLCFFINSMSEKSIFHFMEYGKLLATSWNTSLPNNAELYPIFPTTHSETKHISPLGWKIFKSLIRNPGSSIIELSKINNKPRNTIARWLHFFQQNNLYLTRYIPDLGKLGFNILTFYNLSTRGFSIKNRIKYLKAIQ